ncbi:MAG: carboxypeptidase regulatory-like domain-containing protein [Gammaproteobacteria bacterium]|nr:carboxypeptidase regulatory-like domain-containing protein [Gammaproteobacteria bacterium]MBI5618653.1 carboxypeptidase regulatory-like domain-containing protein [Gammaproteobacteria bacterium]
MLLTACVVGVLHVPCSSANGRIFFGDEKPDAEANGAPFFGFVRDGAGGGVPEAQVTLESREAKTRLVLQTDKLGHFYFSGFRKEFDPRRVQLGCGKTGYRLVAKRLQPPRGKPTAKTPIEVHCTLEKIAAE